MAHLIGAYQLALHALHLALMKDCQSHYLWIDSTMLPVCRNHRIQQDKSLAAIATRCKSSMGWWFYDCKLHIVMNQFGAYMVKSLAQPYPKSILLILKWLSS